MGVSSLYGEWTGGRVFTVQRVEWWACLHCTVSRVVGMSSLYNEWSGGRVFTVR